MRRRTFLVGGAATAATTLAGCSGFLGGGGPERTAEGYFVLETAKHNDFRGEYLVDGIANDGGVVESFENGLEEIREVKLDSTQSYDTVTQDAIDGKHALYYEYGPQDSKSASNSRGILWRAMAVEGATRLTVWARDLAVPQDDIRLGWGYEGVEKGYALAFNLHRETTGQIHVQTNAGDGTNTSLDIMTQGVWLKYEFVDVDWEAGTATARIETEGGDELANQPVEFEPPAE